MLRVVIDTNIIISALNFGGKPKDVLELARKKKTDLKAYRKIKIVNPFDFLEIYVQQ
jgi:predicted nucleic acid-binding protein